jgi:hypothetical protein
MSIVRTIAHQCLYISLLISSLFLSAQAPAREYQIKAVFLFNFAQFVEWPSDAFPETNSPLIIGVLGKDPFGDYLDETVRGEAVNGHPIVVQRYNQVQDVKTCHILFINPEDASQFKSILENLKAQNTLTVGDVNTFVRQGGMIRFYTENGKIRIRINLDSVKEADLTISSKLLRLADVVSSQKNE